MNLKIESAQMQRRDCLKENKNETKNPNQKIKDKKLKNFP